MLDALAYLRAARTTGASAALEVSRSGRGAQVWLFFTAPVPAVTARLVGRGLLREAIAVRGGSTWPATTGSSHPFRASCRLVGWAT
jgi:hypothetical protein